MCVHTHAHACTCWPCLLTHLPLTMPSLLSTALGLPLQLFSRLPLPIGRQLMLALRGAGEEEGARALPPSLSVMQNICGSRLCWACRLWTQVQDHLALFKERSALLLLLLNESPPYTLSLLTAQLLCEQIKGPLLKTTRTSSCVFVWRITRISLSFDFLPFEWALSWNNPGFSMSWTYLPHMEQ